MISETTIDLTMKFFPDVANSQEARNLALLVLSVNYRQELQNPDFWKDNFQACQRLDIFKDYQY